MIYNLTCFIHVTLIRRTTDLVNFSVGYDIGLGNLKRQVSQKVIPLFKNIHAEIQFLNSKSN